jgi:hypothetical protein
MQRGSLAFCLECSVAVLLSVWNAAWQSLGGAAGGFLAIHGDGVHFSVRKTLTFIQNPTF